MDFDVIKQQASFKNFRKDVSESIRPLVVVVGSGLSKPAGLPDWSGLRRELQKVLDDQKRSEILLGKTENIHAIERASAISDYWNFFDRAKSILKMPTFNNVISGLLTPKSDVTPKSYKELLKLKPRGIVTLNLDPFAGDIIASAHTKKLTIPVYGTEIGQKWKVIQGEAPFIVYLHGHLSDPETWVLTAGDLRNLNKGGGKDFFLKHLYLNFTVLFVGVSADDMSLSKSMISLVSNGFKPSSVYWLTNRLDISTETWAEKNSIELIKSNASNEREHEQTIEFVCSNVSDYFAKDDDQLVPEPGPDSAFEAILLSEDTTTLPTEHPEKIRKTLSTLLYRKLTVTPIEKHYETFLEFCKEYEHAVHSAYFKSSELKYNQWFGYRLLGAPLGIGNFGEVFQAQTPVEDYVAVKVMHQNILKNVEMLMGFRRGVKSMKILNRNSIAGVARLITSFEMPPTIVMEHVSGNSLQEVFEGISKIPWQQKIRILKDVAGIVDECHRLPEHVLHRDIKPSNVMLQDFDYATGEYSSLVVLDFDMSWHKGSNEKDVVFETRDDFGYLAPEQTNPKADVSARSTKVDSYGFGMLAYAVFGGQHPIANAALSPSWPREVKQAAKNSYASSWKSLHAKLARTIVDSTKFNQIERLEFASVRRRVAAILGAMTLAQDELQIDLQAEELLCILSDGNDYEWSDLAQSGFVNFVSGLRWTVSVNNDLNSIAANLVHADQGNERYALRDQKYSNVKDTLAALGKVEGISIADISIVTGRMSARLNLSGDLSLNKIEQLGERLLVLNKNLKTVF